MTFRFTRIFALLVSLLVLFVTSPAPVDAGEEPVVPVAYLPMISKPLPPAEKIAIAAGSFFMGCDRSIDPRRCSSDGVQEAPYHTVTLSAYRIDKYEVSNAHYAVCVASGGCSAPSSTEAHNSITNGWYEYYNVSAFSNYPMINVTWHQADAFCRWSGGRLPTEAEWERAARGKNDRRVWPWGNTLACSNANVARDVDFTHCRVGKLTPVGNYPNGASPEGVMDMAGNAVEWVNDWSAREYTEDPVTNPQGPASGILRVLRGGSYDAGGTGARVSYRDNSNLPDYWSPSLGFRCVYSP